eukprot:NODE_2964_length_839_cov_175.294937_g2459_i0.p3 GENE.NODE_2964_length_839_cov_175.294937_g2459_i0~~NODE_2964_length_839_cov_175.294937_g2459_i0.p3  ORF type:complete len:104 (+),score=23.89 NODE_2964_length_839_cov_175.294937_g2459_i0:245-556(+)
MVFCIAVQGRSIAVCCVHAVVEAAYQWVFAIMAWDTLVVSRVEAMTMFAAMTGVVEMSWSFSVVIKVHTCGHTAFRRSLCAPRGNVAAAVKEVVCVWEQVCAL